MKYLVYAYSDWKNHDAASPMKGPVKPYHKIHAVLLDVKSVMQNYNKSGFAQKQLAELLIKAP